MKNVKFGVFCLGLLVAIVTVVSSLSAQGWVQAQPDPPFEFEQGRRVERPNVMVMEGRGAQLGVMISDPSTRQSPQADSGALRAGVVVDDVNPDSPAEKAGIKAGDLIVEYDGERVRSARQFTRLVQETPDGRAVAIGLMRDGKKQTVNATPESGRVTWNFGPFDNAQGKPEVDRAMREAERGWRDFRFDMPDFDFRFDDRNRDNREPRRFEYRLPDRVFPVPSPRFQRGRLGVSVQSLTPELQEYFGAKNGGALVSSVSPDSAASKAGVKAGDVIVSVNGRSVRDSDDLIRELDGINPLTPPGAGGEVTIVVLRDKKETTLKATLQADRPSGERAIRPSRPGLIL